MKNEFYFCSSFNVNFLISLLIVLARPFNIMANRLEWSKHSCIFPHVRRKHCLLRLNMILSSGFSQKPLMRLKFLFIMFSEINFLN